MSGHIQVEFFFMLASSTIHEFFTSYYISIKTLVKNISLIFSHLYFTHTMLEKILENASVAFEIGIKQTFIDIKVF